MRQLSSTASRVLFGVSVVLAGLAIWEKAANLFGLHLSFLGQYSPSRLLELTAVALLFVIAIQLREIKQGRSGPGGVG
jgi:hypothetical protein